MVQHDQAFPRFRERFQVILLRRRKLLHHVVQHDTSYFDREPLYATGCGLTFVMKSFCPVNTE